MALLTREDINKVVDIKSEIVDVPEWGGQVRVAGMNAHDRDEWEVGSLKKDGTQNMDNWRARLCAACIIDEDGNRLFTKEQVDELSKKSGAALHRVFEVANKLNFMNKDAIEDSAKN